MSNDNDPNVSKWGRKNASIQEILAQKARLIRCIAKLRASFVTMHDAMAHLNALRSKVKSLRAENRARTKNRRMREKATHRIGPVTGPADLDRPPTR